MSINIIYGPSGHGKTYLLYRDIIDRAVNNPKDKFVLIVPEQSSLQAQKQIVRMHPNHGVFNIDVLTFGRLAYRVFEELCVELCETIDETGKNLILRKVIDECRDELKIIKAGRKQGFVSEMKSMISELKQYGITPEELFRIIENEKSDRLKEKLMDIHRIYTGFEAYIEGKYITLEDKPDLLYKIIEKSNTLKDSIIIFDGFTGFTPVQFRLIDKLSLMAGELYFTITISDDTQINIIKSRDELFFMSKEMYKKLGEIADRNRIAFTSERVTTETGSYRFRKNAELDFLERNIFRYNGKKYTNSERPENIAIAKLSNANEEIQYVAAAILKAVRENNYRYKDIAVVLGDMENYADEIERVFNEAKIPYFMDNMRSILGNPMVDFIRGMLEIAMTNYSYESVFRVLKNGLCSIDAEQVDIFENYILALGIRGENRYKDRFVRNYGGKNRDLMIINETREVLLDITDGFVTKVNHGDKTVKTYIEAIYEMMESCDLYNRLNEMAENCESEIKGEELRKSYNHVIGLLDRIYGLLSDEKISLMEFSEIIDAGFEEIKMGIIPVSSDCVIVGDLERTRLDKIKMLIVMGANEGIIPKISDNHGILSEEERRILQEKSIVLAPSPRDKVFIQNFYLYLNLTKPEEKLLITYHLYNNEGKEAGASRIINMFLRMYEGLTVIAGNDIKVTDFLTNKSNSLHLITTDALTKDTNKSENMAAILLYLLEDEQYHSVITDIIDKINNAYLEDKISRLAAEELYEELISSSISRIETYAACAFKHFITYGLQLQEREEYELNNMDIGDVFHKVLELIGLELEKSGNEFMELTDEDRYELTVEMVDKATIDFKASFFTENSTNAYMKKRLTDIVYNTLWALSMQLKAGEFKPFKFENKFSYNTGITNIIGKVDRIDIAKKNNEEYIKIIDYKSGEKNISREDLLAGTNLQLLVYMYGVIHAEAKKSDINIKPAAALYNRIFSPIIEEGNDPLKAYRPTGIVAYDSIPLLDGDFEKESLVIPVKTNKEGVVPIDEKVVTDEQFNTMSEYAIDKMNKMLNEIKEGNVMANPYEKGCDYCGYRGICGFNAISRGEYRRKPQPDKERFYEQLREDMNNGMD